MGDVSGQVLPSSLVGSGNLSAQVWRRRREQAVGARAERILRPRIPVSRIGVVPGPATGSRR